MILKATRDGDVYVRWSTVAEGPTWVGSREELLADLLAEFAREHPDCDPKPGAGPHALLQRVDQHGTSALWPSPDNPAYGYTESSLIYEQRGLVARDAVGVLALRLFAGEPRVDDLIIPFEGAGRG